MPRVLFKGAAFLLVGLVILHGLAAVVETVSPDGTAFLLRVDREKVAAVHFDAPRVEAIAVGSSHGDSLDFEAMGYRGYQLSRAWGDVFEIQYYLDYFVPRLPSLRTVFISVSFNTFTQDNARVLGNRRAHLYRTLPSWRCIAGDEWRCLEAHFERLVPIRTITREDHWKAIFYTLIGGGGASTGDAWNEPGCTHMDDEGLVRHARDRLREQVAFTARILAERGTMPQESYQVLSWIVKDLRARGVRTVFFTPPYSAGYLRTWKAEAPEGVAMTRASMARLAREAGATYYDFSEDARFAPEPALFHDSDHLNRCGKRQFSAEFARQLALAENEPPGAPVRVRHKDPGGIVP